MQEQLEQKSKAGADLIAEERRRQIEQEGWSKENDDANNEGELMLAANAYINGILAPNQHPQERHNFITGMYWPRRWSPDWYKPTNAIRDLVKAGALIAAEIDRLQRKGS